MTMTTAASTLCPLSSSPPPPLSDLHRSDDALFYDAPRFVTHIDDAAISSLTEFYSRSFPASDTPGTALLDLCSSWISHYPKGYKAERVVGLGMNAEELRKNAQLTESVVQDLNKDPRLPFEVSSLKRFLLLSPLSFFSLLHLTLFLSFLSSRPRKPFPPFQTPKRRNRTSHLTSSPTA